MLCDCGCDNLENVGTKDMDDLHEGLAKTLSTFAEAVKQCLFPTEKFREVFVVIQPALKRMVTLAAINDAAEKLSYVQYVLPDLIPR